ncbi:hypothetical protein GCM10025858_40400 [Alicyclobacillus sacchari]|nr:hypothetical protein GCM10025858_39490 [Alicyclobacillus sacchari]GMA59536.1 hypothetical protein GCM10025858_40400 [Alicyclobacillus sacchari]
MAPVKGSMIKVFFSLNIIITNKTSKIKELEMGNINLNITYPPKIKIKMMEKRETSLVLRDRNIDVSEVSFSQTIYLSS